MINRNITLVKQFTTPIETKYVLLSHVHEGSLSHVHEGSPLWLGTSNTCTWMLSSLSWYFYHMYMKALCHMYMKALCHMYMKAHCSGLVPLPHVHEGSLLWPGTSITCTWSLTFLAWYLYHMYRKAHFSALVPLSHVDEGSLLWHDTDTLVNGSGLNTRLKIPNQNP